MSAIDDLVPLRSTDDEFDSKLPGGEDMALGDIALETQVDAADQAQLDPKDFWHEDDLSTPAQADPLTNQTPEPPKL